MTTVEQLASEDASNGEPPTPDERVATCMEVMRQLEKVLLANNCQLDVVATPPMVVIVNNRPVSQTYQLNIIAR